MGNTASASGDTGSPSSGPAVKASAAGASAAAIDLAPVFGERVFVAEGATIVGPVTFGDDCSVWFGASVRVEGNTLTVGPRTNIQDNVSVHADLFPVTIGADVSIGHNAVVHGCTVGDKCLIGMGAILMNGCSIGEGSIVGAGTLVKEGTQIAPGSLVVGVPARVVKEGVGSLAAKAAANASVYVALKDSYMNGDFAVYRGPPTPSRL